MANNPITMSKIRHVLRLYFQKKGKKAISSLSGLTPNTTYYVRTYATNSVGITYGNELDFVTLPDFTCGSAITISHLAGNVSLVSKTVVYGTVSNIPGESSKCWITSNLGASHQANAFDDSTEASAGWYWQFNRKQGYKHDGSVRTPITTWITIIDENSDWTIDNDPCNSELGSVWRIPTYAEWNNVNSVGNWTNWNNTWNSGLKLHAAGYLLHGDGSLIYRGPYGHYSSSTQYTLSWSWVMYFDYRSSGMNYLYLGKATGSPLRCIRE